VRKVNIFHPVDIEGNFSLSSGLISTERFHALRCHMHPELDKEGYGLLPSAMAHNGQVIVTSPKLVSFPMNKLAYRTTLANYYRNNWVVAKKQFPVVDEYNGECGYYDEFVIPKMKRKDKDIEFDYSLKLDKDDIAVRDQEVDEGILVPFLHARVKADETDVANQVNKEMKKFRAGTAEYVRLLTLKWGKKSTFLCAGAAYTSGIDLGALISVLQDNNPKEEKVIGEAYAKALEEEEKLLQSSDEDGPVYSEGEEEKPKDPIPVVPKKKDDDGDKEFDYGELEDTVDDKI